MTKRLTPIAHAVRFAMKCGVTSVAELALELECSHSAIYRAIKQLRDDDATVTISDRTVKSDATVSTVRSQTDATVTKSDATVSAGKERVSPHTPLPKEITTLPSSVVLEDTPHCAAPDRMLVEKRIRQAAGDRLNCMAPGLHDISAVMGLLEGGADLERDVVPAIAAKARSMQPGSVSSWGYMIPVIRDAMAKRRQGSAAVVSIGKDAADEQIRRIRAIAGDTSRGRMMPVEEAWS